MITLRDQYLIDVLTIMAVLPQEEIDQIEAFTGNEFEHQTAAAIAFQLPGLHWTIASEEMPLVVCGYMRVRTGVYRSWYCARAEAWTPENAPMVSQLTANVIQQMLTTGDMHRSETIVLASRDKVRKWYGRLGLEYESTLRGFGVNGEDAAMYVALRSKT